MHTKRTTLAICEVCNQNFIALDKSAKRFCSRECYYIGIKTQPWPSLKVPRICEQCGETFHVLRRQVDRGRRFCSRTCYGESQRLPLADRIRAGVDRSNPDGCWPWMMARDRNGYGVLTINNLIQRVHRLAWMLANGPIPEGHGVLHRCDNPPCCRPDHLFTGTQADNVTDMVAKGRHRNHR